MAAHRYCLNNKSRFIIEFGSQKALRELDTQCAWGCKKNSQGNIQFWKGYNSLMDAAYDAPEIRNYSAAKGRIALIDYNKRRKDSRPPMDPAQKKRFGIRSTVERSNSHLKDWLLPAKLMVKIIKIAGES